MCALHVTFIFYDILFLQYSDTHDHLMQLLDNPLCWSHNMSLDASLMELPVGSALTCTVSVEIWEPN